MTMKIRLIATDLDGTLLGADRRISPRTAGALRECVRRGVTVAFVSGRDFEGVSPLALGIGLNECVIISCNGSRTDASANGPIIDGDYMPEALAREVAERILDAGFYLECFSDGRIYMANREASKKHVRMPGRNASGTLECIAGRERLLEEGTPRTRKFFIVVDDASEIDRARAILSDLPLSLSQSGNENLEIMREGSGKGHALRRYIERAGLTRDEVMAFGDQTNDLDMLREAGFPVAMGNAVDEVKAFARLVAPRHDEDGVAQVIEELVLRDRQ